MKRIKTLKFNPDTGEVIGKISGDRVISLSNSDENFCRRRNLKIAPNLAPNIMDTIYFAYPLISEFLTGYDAHQFAKTSKLVNTELNEHDIWGKILTRDYPLFIQKGKNVKLSLLQLEYGETCRDCECNISHVCHIQKTMAQAKIMYKLSRKELDTLPRSIGEHPSYHSVIYFFRTDILRRKAMEKYHGLTNFSFHLERLKGESEKRAQIRSDKELSKRNWMMSLYCDEAADIAALVTELNPTDLSASDAMTRNIRKGILEAELSYYGVVVRSDSELSRMYIEGENCLCVKLVGAFLYMTKILFNYNYVAFSEYHQMYKAKIINRLYEFRSKPFTSELCKKVVDTIHDKLQPRLRHYG